MFLGIILAIRICGFACYLRERSAEENMGDDRFCFLGPQSLQ